MSYSYCADMGTSHRWFIVRGEMDSVQPLPLTMDHLCDVPISVHTLFLLSLSLHASLLCFLLVCVSFGGVEMYGKGCAYNLFSGKDASRCLAKMSFDVEHLDDPRTDDLSGMYVCM